MKRSDILVLLGLAVIFGFFIATANDRGRYAVSILPLFAAVIIAFRPRKQ